MYILFAVMGIGTFGKQGLCPLRTAILEIPVLHMKFWNDVIQINSALQL